MKSAFTFLLVPILLAGRNRARHREPGDLARAGLFGGIALGVAGLYVSALLSPEVKKQL